MPPSPWIGSFPKAGGPPSQIPPAPGTIPMSIVRQMTQTTASSGRVTICGPERHIQVECQDAATLTNMVTHFTAHEQNMLQQVLNTQLTLHQQTLMQQQLQFQMMMTMCQNQWSFPTFGPQNERPARLRPYDRSEQLQDATVVIDSTRHSTTEPPEFGIFMHKWGSELLPSEVLPPSVMLATNSVSFLIGRSPDLYEVREVSYPHLGGQQAVYWVCPPVSRIKIGIFDQMSAEDSLKQIDWTAVYEMLLRIRRHVLRFSFRLTNALEEGRIREFQQSYIPDPTYYTTSRGFTPSAQISSLSKYYVEFLQEDLAQQFPHFFTSAFRHTVQAGIQLLGESILLYVANSSLVETTGIIADHKGRPLAVVSKLTPNHLEMNRSFDSKYYYMFAHNTSALSAAHSISEGFIRPSASDPKDLAWFPTNSFYARGQEISGPQITESQLIRLLTTAQKYGGFGTSRPLTVVGTAVSRQPHFRVTQGGVIADHAAAHFYDVVHGSDRRWAFRSHLCTIHYLCVILRP